MDDQRSRTEIHIDTLSLQGFDGAAADRVGRSLRAELAALCQASGLTNLRGPVDVMPVHVRLSPGSDPEQTGRTVARSIFNGLSASAGSAGRTE